MRRSTPALFEVLGGGGIGRRAGAPAPPVTPVAPRNGTPVEVVAPEPVAAPEPAHDRWDAEPPARSFNLQRRFSVSLSVILLAAAGVIALCVFAWSAAYEAGKAEAEEAARRDLRQSAGGVKDPLNSDLPLNTGLVQDRPAPAAAVPGAPPPSQQRQAAPGDPREPGKNYLQLVTTDRAEAEGIIKFLGENGVAAFMLPVGVDAGRATAKNPGRFTVFCSRGITREEFQARAPAREELYDAVGRLGRVWKGERRGSTDFSGRFWNKYTG